MTTETMTEETFWNVVDQTNWRGLIVDGVKRPYEQGKKNMLEVLPTKEDMESFRHVFQKMRGKLTQALDEFEQETGQRVPVSDDGWSDLSAMVIGLGRVEFEKTLKDPSLLMKRANSGFSGVNGYVESFAYCIPGSEDYDPVPLKLARALNGLRHWQERLEDPEYTSTAAVREVERRQEEVDELREELERLGEEEWTQERYGQHLKAKEEEWRALSRKRFEEAQKVRKEKEKAKAEFLKKYGSWD